MQLAALAAADLGLKRGREEEGIFRQLQSLRAGIRRENTHRESGGHLTRGEREAHEPLPRSLPVSRGRFGRDETQGSRQGPANQARA